MPVYVYVAACGVSISVFLFRFAFGGGPRASAAARAHLGSKRTQKMLVEESFSSRFLQRFRNIPFIRSTDELGKRIGRSGLKWRAADVQLFKVVATLGAVLVAALLAVGSGSATGVSLVVLLGASIAMLPEARIGGLGAERQRRLELQLPDILDRLTISMEAGLGFDSALAHVVEGKVGPGYDEFRRVLQDLQLGVPRDVALGTLAERTTVQDLRIVVSAIVQSGRYGLPLADVLRVQTAELRDKRWNRAQETALKIPVKILMPLIFCILPTLFLAILGPAVLRAIRSQ